MLLLASMTAVLVTGLLISKTLPTAIAGARGLQVWHYFFAAAALVLSGIHLGLHGAHLKNNLWKKLPLPEKAGKYLGAALLCLLFLFGSYSLLTTHFPSLFYSPFIGMGASQNGGFPAFDAMEHNGFDTMEHNGQGMGEGAGKGMGRDQSGFGEGRGRGQGDPGFDMNQAPQGLSIGSAVSTFAAYASILCWFAIVTAVLSAWVRKLLHANKSKE